MKTKRYKVTKPVKDGYAYFDVVDTQNNNFAVVRIFERMPDAEKLADEVCASLNG